MGVSVNNVYLQNGIWEEIETQTLSENSETVIFENFPTGYKRFMVQSQGKLVSTAGAWIALQFNETVGTSYRWQYEKIIGYTDTHSGSINFLCLLVALTPAGTPILDESIMVFNLNIFPTQNGIVTMSDGWGQSVANTLSSCTSSSVKGNFPTVTYPTHLKIGFYSSGTFPRTGDYFAAGTVLTLYGLK